MRLVPMNLKKNAARFALNCTHVREDSKVQRAVVNGDFLQFLISNFRQTPVLSPPPPPLDWRQLLDLRLQRPPPPPSNGHVVRNVKQETLTADSLDDDNHQSLATFEFTVTDNHSQEEVVGEQSVDDASCDTGEPTTSTDSARTEPPRGDAGFFSRVKGDFQNFAICLPSVPLFSKFSRFALAPSQYQVKKNIQRGMPCPLLTPSATPLVSR